MWPGMCDLGQVPVPPVLRKGLIQGPALRLLEHIFWEENLALVLQDSQASEETLGATAVHPHSCQQALSVCLLVLAHTLQSEIHHLHIL